MPDGRRAGFQAWLAGRLGPREADAARRGERHHDRVLDAAKGPNSERARRRELPGEAHDLPEGGRLRALQGHDRRRDDP